MRRTISTALLCCLFLGGCADSVGEGVQGYVVRPQDTLYSIAWRHDLDFRDLARWNNIGPDLHISVGQVLVLGPGGSPSASSASRSGLSTAPSVPQSSPRTAGAPSGATGARPPPQSPGPGKPAATNPGPAAQAGMAAAMAQKWVWPTDRVGPPLAVPGGGILLSGVLGQDVRATSAGRVVYTGSGLRGYGNLIIVKHGDSLLSAYAHNREMLVHDGQYVTSGQVIGHMGEGAHQAATLYFEIRLNGRPIDPLPLLSIRK